MSGVGAAGLSLVVGTLFFAPLVYFGELAVWSFDEPVSNLLWDEAGMRPKQSGGTDTGGGGADAGGGSGEAETGGGSGAEDSGPGDGGSGPVTSSGSSFGGSGAEGEGETGGGSGGGSHGSEPYYGSSPDCPTRGSERLFLWYMGSGGCGSGLAFGRGFGGFVAFSFMLGAGYAAWGPAIMGTYHWMAAYAAAHQMMAAFIGTLLVFLSLYVFAVLGLVGGATLGAGVGVLVWLHASGRLG